MNIVIRFDSVVDATNFLQNYEYPCSFIVDNEIYDKNAQSVGKKLPNDNYMELNIKSIINVIIDRLHFKESEICYDGDNLFLYKGEDN